MPLIGMKIKYPDSVAIFLTPSMQHLLAFYEIPRPSRLYTERSDVALSAGFHTQFSI